MISCWLLNEVITQLLNIVVVLRNLGWDYESCFPYPLLVLFSTLMSSNSKHLLNSMKNTTGGGLRVRRT